MHADLLHPTRFLKSAEFKGKDVTFTIADVVMEELEREDNSKERKGVVGFRETEKLLVINKTNAKCIIGMFGLETEAWKGKRVTFFPFPMKDPFTGDPITGIRVRGSPDIEKPVSVSIKLRKKKAQTMTMQRTGGAAPAPNADPVEVQMETMRTQFRALTTSEAMDAMWTSGLGSRVALLPAADQVVIKGDFATHRRALVAAAKSAEPPPGAEPEASPPPA